MGIVAVDPAVRQQAHEMQGLAVVLGRLHGMEQGRVLGHVPLFGRLGDAGQFLIHNTARANIGVAHLRVAHLPVRQAHVQARGPDFGHRVFLEDALQVGGIGGHNGVALVRGNAKAVQNHQN